MPSLLHCCFWFNHVLLCGENPDSGREAFLNRVEAPLLKMQHSGLHDCAAALKSSYSSLFSPELA